MVIGRNHVPGREHNAQRHPLPGVWWRSSLCDDVGSRPDRWTSQPLAGTGHHPRAGQLHVRRRNADRPYHQHDGWTKRPCTDHHAWRPASIRQHQPTGVHCRAVVGHEDLRHPPSGVQWSGVRRGDGHQPDDHAREIILEAGTSISVDGASTTGTGAGSSTTTPPTVAATVRRRRPRWRRWHRRRFQRRFGRQHVRERDRNGKPRWRCFWQQQLR